MDFKPINPFTELSYPQQQEDPGMMVGGNLMLGRTSSISVGVGNTSMYVDKDGLRLGGSKLETAPFYVDMKGNMYLRTADGSTVIDTVNKRIIINDGSHDRVLIGYLQNGF